MEYCGISSPIMLTNKHCLIISLEAHSSVPIFCYLLIVSF